MFSIIYKNINKQKTCLLCVFKYYLSCIAFAISNLLSLWNLSIFVVIIRSSILSLRLCAFRFIIYDRIVPIILSRTLLHKMYCPIFLYIVSPCVIGIHRSMICLSFGRFGNVSYNREFCLYILCFWSSLYIGIRCDNQWYIYGSSGDNLMCLRLLCDCVT